MEKKELKKILLRKKETALKKKQELIEENKEYHEKLANDFEKLRIALFTDLSEKFFFENKKNIKVMYYCYYTNKYKCDPYFTFEIHDIKNNNVFYVCEKDLDKIKEKGDGAIGNIKLKFSKSDCIISTIKKEAVPIKFIIAREEFEKTIKKTYKNILNGEEKVKKLKNK